MSASLFVWRSCIHPSRDALLKSFTFRTPMVNQSKGIGGSRSGFRKANISVKRPSLKERPLAPEQGTAFNLGKGVLMGASAFGVGSLCYYGLGLSSEPGAVEKSMMWPQYVKDRIKSTYKYFGGSVAITAASAFAVILSPKFLNLMMRHSFLAFVATFAAVIGSSKVVFSMPYSEGFGGKQIAWVVHCGIMGAVIAPLCWMCGPWVLRAVYYTAFVVGGLTAVATCAPSEKFLYMGGPLACGLGVVFASSLASMFVSYGTALEAVLYSISMYGGLVVFGGLLLYDTQRIIRKAETYPVDAVTPFDPVNESMSIYSETLNIFIRILVHLASAGLKIRRK